MTFLFTVVVTLLVVGVLLWAINALPFIDAGMKQIIRVVIIVIVALWLIGMLVGAIPPFSFRFPN